MKCSCLDVLAEECKAEADTLSKISTEHHTRKLAESEVQIAELSIKHQKIELELKQKDAEQKAAEYQHECE